MTRNYYQITHTIFLRHIQNLLLHLRFSIIRIIQNILTLTLHPNYSKLISKYSNDFAIFPKFAISLFLYNPKKFVHDMLFIATGYCVLNVNNLCSTIIQCFSYNNENARNKKTNRFIF